MRYSDVVAGTVVGAISRLPMLGKVLLLLIPWHSMTGRRYATAIDEYYDYDCGILFD